MHPFYFLPHYLLLAVYYLNADFLTDQVSRYVGAEVRRPVDETSHVVEDAAKRAHHIPRKRHVRPRVEGHDVEHQCAAGPEPRPLQLPERVRSKHL